MKIRYKMKEQDKDGAIIYCYDIATGRHVANIGCSWEENDYSFVCRIYRGAENEYAALVLRSLPEAMGWVQIKVAEMIEAEKETKPNK